MNYHLKDTAEYLKQKGVSFAVKENYLTNTAEIIGVTITKHGKFFKANGTIISGNMIEPINKKYPLN